MAGAKKKSISVKTPEEIEIMRQANQIVAGVLTLLSQEVKDGTSTYYLDQLAETYCRDHGAVPAFKGYRGFPGSLCTSVNEEVVHGIPSKSIILKEGDIISIDFGAYIDGFYGDSAITLPVGTVSEEIRRLLDVTETALYKGIEQVKPGNRVSDISRAVQQHAEGNGFSIVRQFVGHGIGTELHEAPEVPNYVQRSGSPRLLAGMVIAIEPMVNMGTEKVKILDDQWTVITGDRKPSAHFEHTVAVTEEGSLILSDRR
ncbi:MAG: type I methionyl aminopeptidase [Desulfobulbus propionicus]|nr:MAG: type I methionyl aminopeptidase [Desulfobulbus propionicus]PIE66106.1 MAG: type I methionyl aminopeptidase [Desulfobacterales bacterium]